MSWLISLQYLWWILALILIAAELLALEFFLLWIGIAAAVTGVVMWLVPGLGVLPQALLFVKVRAATP